jgi:hypothetical protein
MRSVCTVLLKQAKSHFSPSPGKPRPSFPWLERRSAGQAFADGFAHSEHRIVDQTCTVYTDTASVVYRSAVFEMSKIAAAKAAHCSKVLWGERRICICSALVRSEHSEVGVYT